MEAPSTAPPMPLIRLADQTWEAVRDLDRSRAVAILPIGAVEAHGPHLPMAADVIIAEAMARAGGQRLAARGHAVLVLPSLVYTAAEFAAGFPGTISLRPSTVTATVVDVAAGLGRHGIRWLAIANAHLDPAHIAALEAAAREIEAEGRVTVVFPNLARKPWALRLTEEFQSGACHAGRYESSVILAERRDLVRDGLRKRLPPNPASLLTAIRAGKRTFEEAEGPRAYFGYPAEATAKEGRETIAQLGAILEEAVLAAIGAS